VLGVTLEGTERGLDDAPLVATHEVELTTTFTGDAVQVSLTPPPDVRVVRRNSGGDVVDLIAPTTATLPVTVAWYQAADPSDPSSDPTDPATRCAASTVATLAVESARRSHSVDTRVRGLAGIGVTDFAVMPAAKRPDLSPLEISSRTTSRAAFPPARAKARRMAVPLRAADQVKYRTHLPNPAQMSVALACRFYYLACATPFASGGAFVQVGRLLLDDDALARGIERGDPNGQLILLARSQPSRSAARYGVSINARPGGVRRGHPRPFGYDVHVRQSGRLLARVRVAGLCREVRGSRGIFTQCRIARRSIQLR
jgi:hypothetical protein